MGSSAIVPAPASAGGSVGGQQDLREFVPSGSRKLRVELTGDPAGMPVFLMHGTPGSRSGPKPRGIVLHRMGIHLITYDRPGYGESTRHKGRTVADAAEDVAAIADEFGFPAFAVAGRSGGAPHALACAALLPGRVTRAAVLVSSAPPDSAPLDWYEGMHEVNAELRDQDISSQQFEDDLRRRVDRIQEDPEELVRHLDDALIAEDRRVVEDRALRRLILENYAEAFRQGADGWIDDTIALRRPWGFSLRTVGTEVRLWHGAGDRFAPLSHTRWLARQLPHAHLEEDFRAGHFAAMEVLPEMLAWLAEAAPARRVPVNTGSGRGFAG
jgi:pimeloyl-ACP methyl ester carboxylesterase